MSYKDFFDIITENPQTYGIIYEYNRFLIKYIIGFSTPDYLGFFFEGTNRFILTKFTSFRPVLGNNQISFGFHNYAQFIHCHMQSSFFKHSHFLSLSQEYLDLHLRGKHYYIPMNISRNYAANSNPLESLFLYQKHFFHKTGSYLGLYTDNRFIFCDLSRYFSSRKIEDLSSGMRSVDLLNPLVDYVCFNFHGEKRYLKILVSDIPPESYRIYPFFEIFVEGKLYFVELCESTDYLRMQIPFKEQELRIKN